MRIDWNGEKTYTIQAVDVAGNVSGIASITIDITSITAVTDIVPTGATYTINLALTYATFDTFDTVQVWSASVNNRAAATWSGETRTNTFSHVGRALTEERYYWTRIRDIYGSFGAWYPLSATAGVKGSTSTDPTDYLTILEGSIAEASLVETLVEKMDILDNIDAIIAGDIALLDDIVESGVVVEDAGDVRNLDIRISNAQCSIDVLNAQIELVATQIEVDSLTTRISDAELTIAAGSAGTWASISNKLAILTYNTDQYADGSLRIGAAEERLELIETDTGSIKAQYTVKLDVNGNVAGFGLMVSDDEPSQFVILANKFAVIAPDNDAVTPFIVSTVDGVSSVGIDGNLIVDGSVLANAIAANQITGNHISASSQIDIASSGRLRVGTVGTDDYVELSQADINFNYYDSVNEEYRTYKTLRRIETGSAASGATVTLPGIWKSTPNIVVTPLSMPVFDVDAVAQDQKVMFSASNIQETSSGSRVYTFVPTATLNYASNTVTETTDITKTGTSYNSAITSDTTNLPLNVRSLTVNVFMDSYGYYVSYNANDYIATVYIYTTSDTITLHYYTNGGWLTQSTTTTGTSYYTNGVLDYYYRGSGSISVSSNYDITMFYVTRTNISSVFISNATYENAYGWSTGWNVSRSKLIIDSYVEYLTENAVLQTGTLSWIAIE